MPRTRLTDLAGPRLPWTRRHGHGRDVPDDPQVATWLWGRPSAAEGTATRGAAALPPRTWGEVSREVRMHLRVLRWKVHRFVTGWSTTAASDAGQEPRCPRPL